eukprot:4793165-Amphidinium_carterae.2
MTRCKDDVQSVWSEQVTQQMEDEEHDIVTQAWSDSEPPSVLLVLHLWGRVPALVKGADSAAT